MEIPEAIDTMEVSEIKIESATLRSFDKLRTNATQGDKIYQGIKLRNGSKRDTALSAVFIPSEKQLIIKRFPVKDTVLVTDTLRLKPTDIFLRGNDVKERLIWIMSFLLTSIIIIVYKGYLNVRKFKK